MQESKIMRTSAMTFLQEVHDYLPESYEVLIQHLTAFREKRITCSEIQDRVIQLLHSERQLILAFSQFLPLAEREKFRLRVENLPLGRSLSKRKRDIDYNESSKSLSGLHLYQQQLKSSLPVCLLSSSWHDVLSRVKKMVEKINKDPENWIPVVEMEDILNDCVATSVIERIKVAGVVKVRKTVGREEVEGWNQQLMHELKVYLNLDYTKHSTYDSLYKSATTTTNNSSSTTNTNTQSSSSSFSDSNKADTGPRALEFGGVQDIFYSKAEFAARCHKNMVAVRKWLNKTLWKFKDGEEFVFVPDQETIYIDRMRNRLPSYEHHPGMKDHIDNGSLTHWADTAWQRVYHKIWKGQLSEYDPWDSKDRTDVAGLVFRSFQGWLALTAQGPGDGTLEVIPMVKEAMEYVLLRPLLSDVPPHMFPGSRDQGLGDSIEVSSRWHAPLLQGKLSVGMCEPGDTVWWHPDVVHCVEQEHHGKSPSNVLYIPAAPLCPTNAKYLVRQAQNFRNGDAPPDFVNSYFVERDSAIRAKEEDLPLSGLQMMGIIPFQTKMGPAADRMVDECNAITRVLRDKLA